MIAWLDGDEQPFICIHTPPSAPPTLFFAIAPRSGSPIWIELRVSLDSDVVTSTALKQMFEDMTLDHMFASFNDEEDPGNDSTCTLDKSKFRQLLGGNRKWPVVRVVAPVYSSLAGESFTIPESIGRPVAILNMSSLDKFIDKDQFPDVICIMKDALVSITDWVQSKRKLWLDQPLRFSDSDSEGDWTESDSEDERSESNRHRRDRLMIIADMKRRQIRA
ncbi:hypothetical protein BDZ89DRAFT_433022 [Hymenopellis radicata]|nr:hypothetical protein BDZ89DRAFT_433022 [Hymenopellis radicata]